jgi:hypothetical protein
MNFGDTYSRNSMPNWLVFLILTMILLAASSHAGTARNTLAIKNSNNAKPSITIDQLAYRNGTIASGSMASTNAILNIKGKTVDSSSGRINLVEVRTEHTLYQAAMPLSLGNWSTWMGSLVISTGSHEIVARATDSDGNHSGTSYL